MVRMAMASSRTATRFSTVPTPRMATVGCGMIGVPKRPLARHTPGLWNVAFASHVFWDGRARSLEEQAVGPIEATDEMALPMDALVARLRADPATVAAFARAFPDNPQVTSKTIVSALATYERTLVSPPTRFDRWIEGDDDAIGPAARRGFALFTGAANCSQCHLGWRLTDDGFHDTGLPDTGDPGYGPIVGVPMLDNAFKTPALRNVARRAPYMHDGSLPTLRAVVDHYADGIVERPTLSDDLKRIELSEAERADLGHRGADDFGRIRELAADLVD